MGGRVKIEASRSQTAIGRTSIEKTKKCGQQEKNRTWSRVPKQISVYRILWFNIQNVLHCLLIQRKTWEPAQKRSLWRNPDRKLCFLSFPIAQSNRSPDIQRLLQRFKFLNNIHLWLNQTEQEAHDHLCLVGQQTQSCYSNAFIKKKSIRRSTKNSSSQSIKSFRLTYWGINEQFRLQKQFKRPFSLRDWPD